MFVDALIDACLDTLKLLPFLFATYLFMEWLEHGAGDKIERIVARGGRIGPLVGAVLGVVPQCGFSGAAATLYAARVITLGTLVSVFLVTSDEMLPLMISQAVAPVLIGKVLLAKLAAGLVCGFAIDAILSKMGRLHEGLGSAKRHEGHAGHDIEKLCEEEGCACADSHDRGHDHDGSIVVPALRHSLNVAFFVLIVTLLLNVLVEAGLEDVLAQVTTAPYLSAIVTAVIGFIPNCAVSVGVTQLYLDGFLSGSALMSALTVNSGVGLLVLLRTNHDVNENLKIMLVLLVAGIVTGCAVQVLGVL